MNLEEARIIAHALFIHACNKKPDSLIMFNADEECGDYEFKGKAGKRSFIITIISEYDYAGISEVKYECQLSTLCGRPNENPAFWEEINQ